MGIKYCRICDKIRDDIIPVYGGKIGYFCSIFNESKNDVNIEFNGEFMSETIFEAEKNQDCNNRKIKEKGVKEGLEKLV